MKHSEEQEITRADILRLSAATELDPRTVKRAVDRGLGSMKSERDRTALRKAAKKLKLTLPT